PDRVRGAGADGTGGARLHRAVDRDATRGARGGHASRGAGPAGAGVSGRADRRGAVRSRRDQRGGPRPDPRRPDQGGLAMFWWWGPGGSWVAGLVTAVIWIGLVVAAVLLLRGELPNLQHRFGDPPALRMLEERY